MKRLTRHVAVLAAMLVLAQPALARTEQVEPTTLTSVVESALRHFPRIQAASAKLDAGRGMQLAARGAFDPRVESGGDARLGGYYDGRDLDATVLQALPAFNTRVFAGYRIGAGSFPVYEGGSLTRDLGELKAGVTMSLLRDRDIDSRRAGVLSSDIEVTSLAYAMTVEQVRMLEEIYVAYARWLLAWRLHDSYVELLELAESRGVALDQSVAAGDAADILRVENRQAVLQRQALVLDAQRQIDMAAELLALYLRDDDGEPMLPRYAPELELPAEDPRLMTRPIDDQVRLALERRPELAMARLAQDQARLKLRLAENLRRPRVDVSLYQSRDFGSGPAMLGGTDNVASVRLDIPLRTREADGRAAAARGEITAIAHDLELLEDRLETDLRRARVNLEATRELEALALQELDASEQLAAAERQRFEAGISDFFLLNVRERQVGEAQLKRWQAHLTHQVALASYYAFGMDLEALGWEGASSLSGAAVP